MTGAQTITRRLARALIVVAGLFTVRYSGATAVQPRVVTSTTVSIVAKIIGGNGMNPEPSGVPILNDGYHNVDSADLGAITLYQNTWYMALGDAGYDVPTPWDESNFLVATASYAPDLSSTGIRLTGYLGERGLDSGLSIPTRALQPDPGYTIPGSLFTLHWQGRAWMIAQYMEGGDFGGHDHWSQDSRIALYDNHARIFRPYKPAVYLWQRRDSVSTDATKLQYNFGQGAFWLDASTGYIYMIGAPTNRFGGIKLARIPVGAFLDPRNMVPWSYYLGNNQWSAPTADEAQVDTQVPWLIPPRDPGFSLDKNYDSSAQDECAALTIAEFSLGVGLGYTCHFVR